MDATTELLRLVPQDETAKSYAITLSRIAPQPQHKARRPQKAYNPVSPAKIQDVQSATEEFTAGWGRLRERAQKL